MFSIKCGCRTVQSGSKLLNIKVYLQLILIFPHLQTWTKVTVSMYQCACVWSVSGSISGWRSWCHCYLCILGVPPATGAMMHTMECKIYSNNITNQPAHLPVNNIINNITSILTKYSANIHTNFFSSCKISNIYNF